MAMTLEALHGRVGDVDSHEMMPMEWYPEYFGEIGRRMVDENEDFWRFFARGGNGSIATAKNVRDDKPITEQWAWETKGVWAPGMANMDRRVEAMDAMGIRRQLIFPGFGHVAFIRTAGAGQVNLPPTSPAQVALAREAGDAHNKWAGQ